MTGSLDRFESANSLVDGFQEHIDEFKRLDAAYFSQNPVVHVIEQNESSTYELHKACLVHAPPANMRRMVNRAFGDFRNALDQALFAASWVVGGSRPKDIHFPFGQNPSDFERVFERRRYRSIPKEMIPILQSFEPYPTGEGYSGGNDVLKALNVMVQPSKHEIMLRVSPRGAKWLIGHSEQRWIAGVGGVTEIFSPGKFGIGGKVGEFTLAENEVPILICNTLSHQKPNIQAVLTVCFGELPRGASFFANATVGSAISATADEVSRVVTEMERSALAIARNVR